MKSQIQRTAILLITIHILMASVNGEEKEFHLKANGKDKSFIESCKIVKSYYKKKVACNTYSKEYIGDYLVPLDIKSSSFWQTVCEMSKQSNYGFKPFFDGVIFSNEALIVNYYKMYGESPIVVKGPLSYGNDNEKTVMQLGIYNYTELFKFPDFYDVTLSNGSKTITPKNDGESRGDYFAKLYLIPTNFQKKNIEVSLTLKATQLINLKKIKISAKKDAEVINKNLKLIVTSILKNNDEYEFIYKLDWPSGLMPNEVRKVKKIMASYKQTYKFSEADKQWISTLENRKDLKCLQISTISFFDSTDKECNVYKSTSNLFAPGFGIEGKCKFTSDAIPSYIKFEIGVRNNINKKFIFKDIDLSK